MSASANADVGGCFDSGGAPGLLWATEDKRPRPRRWFEYKGDVSISNNERVYVGAVDMLDFPSSVSTWTYRSDLQRPNKCGYVCVVAVSPRVTMSPSAARVHVLTRCRTTPLLPTIFFVKMCISVM